MSTKYHEFTRQSDNVSVTGADFVEDGIRQNVTCSMYVLMAGVRRIKLLFLSLSTLCVGIDLFHAREELLLQFFFFFFFLATLVIAYGFFLRNSPDTGGFSRCVIT